MDTAYLESAALRLAIRSTSTPNGCLEWSGARGARGYGRISVAGKNRIAHRIAWEVANGSIPDGLIVCHKCDNPPCINPDHLFLGTAKDNADDRDRKGRGRLGEYKRLRTHCPNGHELVAENVYLSPQGWRRCKPCTLAASKRWRLKNRRMN